jgi:hypothetical protein
MAVPWQYGDRKDNMEAMLGLARQGHAGMLAEASPLNFLYSQDNPLVLTLQGSADNLVPVAHQALA